MSDLGDGAGAPSERGCCARCVNGLASSILVFINVIFLLVGVAMTGGSAYGMHTWEKWKPLLGTPIIVYWAMGIGIFMLLLSLLAIIGTCLTNQVSMRGMRGMRGVVRGGSDAYIEHSLPPTHLSTHFLLSSFLAHFTRQVAAKTLLSVYVICVGLMFVAMIVNIILVKGMADGTYTGAEGNPVTYYETKIQQLFNCSYNYVRVCACACACVRVCVCVCVCVC
jgi:hypothetical protein